MIKSDNFGIRKGYYDINAPKFRYIRDPFSFTRKTTRVQKGEKLELGKESVPTSTTRGDSLYPWTKPMIGWKRVFAGYGDWRAKGRRKRSKGGVRPMSAGDNKPKRNFMKYPRTYGWK